MKYIFNEKKAAAFFLSCFAVLSFVLLFATCVRDKAPEVTTRAESVPPTEYLEAHCDEVVGPPRVERISEHVYAAIGYDLANVVLIQTDDGNVIVDAAMSPARARLIKKALYAEVPQAPVRALIFTHSHIDHVGGASEFVEEGTQIWATAPFTEHFLKQYGTFGKAETTRAMRQFGHHIDSQSLPCSALGARMDIDAALEAGVRLPTNVFSGEKDLEIGGLRIELHEGHGETHDQLFVWIPEDQTVIPGDNFYWAFPNLYTVRGSSPRPVNEWIKALDNMRSKDPAHLIGMHTRPIHGKEEIAEALRDYRDAIQWVRDEVIRAANRGEDMNYMRHQIKLPPHLADKRYLHELYGQVDWSAEAIYTNNLGWFDGRADKLYQLDGRETARREVELMGGASEVYDVGAKALADGDAKWAIHLFSKLMDSRLAGEALEEKIKADLSEAYERLASGIDNTNGRAYLLESALELRRGKLDPQSPQANEAIIGAIPLEMIFDIMPTRLRAEDAMDVHESVRFIFPDEGRQFTVTVRRGVAEVIEGEPLPGTPEPVAVVTADSRAYREVALGKVNSASVFLKGDMKVKGSIPKLLKFLDLFETGA